MCVSVSSLEVTETLLEGEFVIRRRCEPIWGLSVLCINTSGIRCEKIQEWNSLFWREPSRNGRRLLVCRVVDVIT